MQGFTINLPWVFFLEMLYHPVVVVSVVVQRCSEVSSECVTCDYIVTVEVYGVERCLHGKADTTISCVCTCIVGYTQCCGCVVYGPSAMASV